MGGVSDGFALEGFDVTGIDIVDAPAKLGYKHRFMQADMLTLNGEDFKGYDVVWGSPPCRDFTIIGKTLGHRWKKPPNPHNGLKLVNCFLAFVEDATPVFWIMENVSLMAEYLDTPPQVTAPLGVGMYRSFWGEYPYFLLPRTTKRLSAERHRLSWKGNGKTKSWERAKIPLPCSRAFARACKQKLLEDNKK